jgi:hypothetical protein
MEICTAGVPIFMTFSKIGRNILILFSLTKSKKIEVFSLNIYQRVIRTRIYKLSSY